MGSRNETLRNLAEQGLAFCLALNAQRDAHVGTLQKSVAEQLRLQQAANELQVALCERCHAILKRLDECEAWAQTKVQESPQVVTEPATAVVSPQPQPEPQVQVSQRLPLGSLFGEDEQPAVSDGLAAIIQ